MKMRYFIATPKTGITPWLGSYRIVGITPWLGSYRIVG